MLIALARARRTTAPPAQPWPARAAAPRAPPPSRRCGRCALPFILRRLRWARLRSPDLPPLSIQVGQAAAPLFPLRLAPPVSTLPNPACNCQDASDRQGRPLRRPAPARRRRVRVCGPRPLALPRPTDLSCHRVTHVLKRFPAHLPPLITPCTAPMRALGEPSSRHARHYRCRPRRPHIPYATRGRPKHWKRDRAHPSASRPATFLRRRLPLFLGPAAQKVFQRGSAPAAGR